MVDIHSHILAEIDDGSKDMEMTINMLKKSEKSGTTDIIATPHFMRGRFEVECISTIPLSPFWLYLSLII